MGQFKLTIQNESDDGLVICEKQYGDGEIDAFYCLPNTEILHGRWEKRKNGEVIATGIYNNGKKHGRFEWLENGEWVYANYCNDEKQD